MSKLNPQQFEDAAAQRGHEMLEQIHREQGLDVGDYSGEPGEPNPDEYNSMDDYLSDHRRWSASRAGGRTFVDRDVSKVKNRVRDDAAEQAKPLKEEHQERVKHVQVQHQKLNRAVRDLRTAMPRVAKPPKLKMPTKAKRRRF